MLNTKNLSPKQLSAFTAAILAIPISIGIWFIKPDWVITIVSLLITFIGSYLLIGFVLESFIYRKIKLIYKFIYQTKATKEKRLIINISYHKRVLMK
jgi:two-component system phosphate regulon sensor histidine kinase PhoR